MEILEILKMNKFKKFLFALAFALVGSFAFAEGDSGFDPSSLIGSATTTVTAIVTAIGSLLAAAIGIYLAFVGYRKAREALNKA